jgi:hypothetical protein
MIPGPIPDIRRDVVKTQAVVSEVQRDLMELRQILKRREDHHSKRHAVSYK